MHKITKGLKKKKKGKKSKHKEEELFKPEELEAYRREHQAHPASGAENEEWKKFHALTSGVDNVLQKTQEELSRIKETSFFQRVAPPSEVQREAEKEAKKEVPEPSHASAEEAQVPDPIQLGIVEVSESESEADDEDDDIFDTAYIDAIASGEVKLAYIPESPTEVAGDDPFDTSYAEKAILGPAAGSKKGKKLVPIGAAVEVLTGRVQLPTCSTQRPAPNRRQIFKDRDLLLGSFDDNANSIADCIKDSPGQPPKTLLDEEAPPDLASEPIDLSKSLYIPPIPVTPSPISVGPILDDSEDDEFDQLATENLNKEPKNIIEKLPVVTPDVAQVIEDHWDAFADEKQELHQDFVEVGDDSQLDIDPFDTTFAENILPGKAELKQIESEILNADVEFEVKPKQEKLLHILKKLSISEEGTRENDKDSTNTFAPPIKPTELHLQTTNMVDPFNGEASRQPPSKETQDLLMSVMGAMDATSSHLLNKIPPTRSPSPVSMRDLHSPSPTPEMYGDLLDVGDSTPSARTPEPVRKDDLFECSTNLSCDINQNPSVAKQPPPKPPPPRPAPPRPAPPAFAQASSKPPPPKPVQPSGIPEASEGFDSSKHMDNDICLFGVDGTLPKKAPATKEDILNLYNTAKSEKKVDLLCGSDEALNIEHVDNFPPSSSNSILSFESSQHSHVIEEPHVELVQEAIAQDNFISPEISQADLQMDTSESHSKGSASSVTFNPFATSEEMQEVNGKAEEVSQIDSSTFQDNNIPTEIHQTYSHEEAFPQISENTTTFDQIIDHNAFVASNDAFGASENVFARPNEEQIDSQDAFGSSNQNFGTVSNEGDADIFVKEDEFDEFAHKFDSVRNQDNDTFAWGGTSSVNAFGDAGSGFETTGCGFEADEAFDSFLALQEPPCVPQSTPYVLSKQPSADSDEDKDFSVFIKPKNDDDVSTMAGVMPILAPPPTVQQAFTDTSPRFNPFDQSGDSVEVTPSFKPPSLALDGAPPLERTNSQESPPTPLFDEDVSQPLEPFPRINFAEEGWEMQLRQPNKKKITGQRFWKKIFVRLVYQQDCVLLQLFNQKDDKDPFQELPLQPCYSVSDIGAQQYDQFGKIFTLKLQYIFYKERPGVRPGQVKKAEKLSNRLSKFAAYAIQGDYEGVKEFGSDLKKLGLPVEHAPQVSQLMKLGSLNYEDLKQFSFSIDEALFSLQAHRDRALHYKMEEVQITVVDELYVNQDADGHIEKQIARVRLFFLGFLTGMPDVELGVNDMRRQGKEVVGRHDIIPVVTEEWIRLEATEFHSCVQQDEYERTHVIKFKPPDACYIELMRFRVRPPRNRELPLQLKASICVTGTKIELRADVLVPGFASRKLGQVPCEDVQIRFPIPECWIYLFRVEKHFRYGSVKSAHRRTGKVKGIDRILGAMETLQESLIEVTSGHAKYEHQHRAIVWRCPRLPKEGQGAYTTHNMVCRLALTSYDQMPEKLPDHCYVEFTMPATQVSHCVCRSVSLQNSDSDDPPEKYVRNLARHEYRVGIEHVQGENPNAYAVATKPIHTVKEEKPPPVPEADSSSDSD